MICHRWLFSQLWSASNSFSSGARSAPDPAGGAYSAPPDHLAGLKWDPTSKQKEREREGRGEGRPPNSLIYPALQGFAGLPLRFVVVDGTCVVVDADY